MRHRKLLLAFVLLCASAAQAAFIGDNINDNIRLTNNTRFNLSGDFCIAGWVQAGATSVSASFSRLVSRNQDNSTGNGAYGLGITSAGIGTAFDELTFTSVDDDGTSITLTGNANSFASITTPIHIAVERNSTTVTIYVNASGVANTTNANFGTVSIPTDGPYTGDLVLFNREHASTFRGFNGSMWEWAAWNTPCNHLAELAGGASPRFYPTGRQWYMPMLVVYQELSGGLAVTNSGTAVTTQPRIIYPE